MSVVENTPIVKYKYKGFLSRYLEYKRLSMARPWISGDKILDLGCCQAKLLEYVTKNVTYVGADINHTLFDFNRRRYPEQEFHRIDLNKIDEKSQVLSDYKFGAILLLAVLEHLESPQNIINYISATLHRYGRLIVTTPNAISEKLIDTGARFCISTK